MATLVNQNNQDVSKQPGATSNTGQTVQPGAAAGTPAYAGASGQTGPASSGRFVNTQAFMNANKNAGQQIGGAIQSGINRQLDQEKTATNKEADNVRAGIQTAQGNVQQGRNYYGQIGGDASKFGVQQPVQKVDYQGMNALANETNRFGLLGEFVGQKNNYGQGGNYYGQIGGDASKFGVQQPVQKLDYEGMNALANDADKFKQFTDFRTGATAQADTTNLNNLNQTYGDRAANANQVLADRQAQLANETNRFGLLGEFVGKKNNYGQGAQRLDQVFLQRDKTGALDNLNKNLAAEKSGAFADMLKQGTALKDTSTGVLGQATDLSQALGAQTGANETGYINELGQKVEGVNADRDAQRQQYKDFLSIMKGQKQGSVADPVWNDFGLTDNMSVYNTFGNINDIGEIANLSAQQAKDYHDVANQQDVTNYGSLAKLAGIGNDKLNAAGNLEAAAKAKAAYDPNSLLNRIVNQYNSTLDTAKGTNLGAAGSAQYYAGTDWTGRSKYGSTTQYANANMGDILKGAGINVDDHAKNIELTNAEKQAMATATNMGPNLTAYQLNPGNAINDAMALGKDAMNRSGNAADQTVNDYASAYAQPKNLTPSQLLNLANPGAAFTNNLGTDLGRSVGETLRNALGLGGNGVAGAEGAARDQAAQNLQQMILDWQKQQGMTNVATRSGVRDANDSNFVNTQKMINGAR